MAIWHQEVWTSIEQSVDNPEILALHRLWQSLRPAEGMLPALAAFSVDGPLSAFAGQVTVFEPLADGDYRVYYCGEEFRRVGCRYVHVRALAGDGGCASRSGSHACDGPA